MIRYLENNLGERSLDRFNSMDEQRNRSVLIANTLIIISYHGLSRVDLQSHSCYARRNEGCELHGKERDSQQVFDHISQKKMKGRAVERLTRLE